MDHSKFLDTKYIRNKGNIITKVYSKTSKLHAHWSSIVPKGYKQNAVIGDLHRSKKIPSNFAMQIKVIKRKFRNNDYPRKFLNSVINSFLIPQNNDLFLIPTDLFEESEPFTFVEIPYFEEHKNASKHF